MSNNPEEIRETLLRFATSELTSHGSLLIGFSVILFAFFELVNRSFATSIVFEPCFRYPVSLRYLLVFLFIGFLIGGIIFVMMRFIFWGRILSRIVYSGSLSETITFDKYWNQIFDSLKFSRPLKWWSKGIRKDPKGLILSLIGGLFASWILLWLFLFN